MSNARKISQLVVGTEVKISNLDSDVNNNLNNIISRLDSDDAKLQSINIAAAAASSVAGISDSDLKVVADLRNDLDSEITYVRNIRLSYTNYLYNATAGQTTFQDSDSNSATLSYTAGSITVFLNGIKLEADDYTATDGTSIVLTTPAGLNSQLSILCPKLESNIIITGVDWTSHSLAFSLQSSSTSENAFFGENLEIDGNYAVIGARGHGPSYTGKAFIFFKNGSTWAQQQELTISDGSTTNFYGQNVSISGTSAAVTSTGGNGACYIFTRSGTTWTQQTKLSAPTASSGFGQEVSLVGDKLVVGMYGYDSGGNTDIGRLVSYTRSGTTWSSATTIDLSDGVAGDLLGYDSIRISEDGNYLIAGVIRRDNSGNTDEGVAYIFYWNGSAWTQQAKLEASDGAASFNFGNAIAITDKYAAVGALMKTSETGAVYIFTRSGTTWTQRIILGAGGSIPNDLSTGDQFGFGVDVHKNSLVVAAANRASPKGNGHVYVFTTSDDGVTWTQKNKFTTPSGDIHDNYGQDSKGVGIDETSETVVVGAGSDDTGNTAAGKIYFYSS